MNLFTKSRCLHVLGQKAFRRVFYAKLLWCLTGIAMRHTFKVLLLLVTRWSYSIGLIWPAQYFKSAKKWILLWHHECHLYPGDNCSNLLLSQNSTIFIAHFCFAASHSCVFDTLPDITVIDWDFSDTITNLIISFQQSLPCYFHLHFCKHAHLKWTTLITKANKLKCI